MILNLLDYQLGDVRAHYTKTGSYLEFEEFKDFFRVKWGPTLKKIRVNRVPFIKNKSRFTGNYIF